MRRSACSAVCLAVLTLSFASPFLTQGQEQKVFKLTLMVPQPNTTRQAWALVVRDSLLPLGIDVGMVVFDWGTIYDRAIQPAGVALGKTYDQGGFDVLFIGYALGIDADPWSLYHSSQFAPTGSNFYLWNNTQNDQLSAQIKETLDKTQRLNMVKQWQALAYEELPSITLLYSKEIVAFDGKMPNAKQVFSTYHYPAWPPIEHLSGPVDGSIILAQTGPAPEKGLNPLLTTSYYDLTVYGPVFNGLAQRNDTAIKNMIPALASGWTVSPDQKTWTVTLRQGVTWHDTQKFNATDVKFTFDSFQNSTLASPSESFYEGIIGGKNNVVVDSEYQVTFHLPAPYTYFVENVLSAPIVPWHILKDIPYADWANAPFNTGVGGGPIGTGPYKFVSLDTTGETNHLTRNDNYFDFPDDGKTALLNMGQFKVKDYYVRHVGGTDAAITELKSGAVDILDSQYHLESQTSFLTEWGTDKWVSYDAYGVQEIGVNMKHPVLGTGVDTPLGKQDPSKAASAAKYVRQAISYAIPRDKIIEQILKGYGNPGITTPVVGNYRTGSAVTEGFNTDLKPYSYNVTKSRELLTAAGYTLPALASPSFWDSYGIYIVSALIAAVVAVSGVYVWRGRQKPLAPVPSAQQPPSTPPATTP